STVHLSPMRDRISLTPRQSPLVTSLCPSPKNVPPCALSGRSPHYPQAQRVTTRLPPFKIARAPQPKGFLRMLNLALIIGSTRPNRFADQPAKWIAEAARARDDFRLT